ncbi:MAG: cyclohydrolase [Archaeoglobi archaeon]|nr:cyclohydrolase [Archaeoglobi archaeon]
MYVGRIVSVGCSGGSEFAAYRVSSRSFPNRIAELRDRTVSILPKNPEDLKKNPYISYNCIRIEGDFAVVSNGSHTDVIAEKLMMGYPPRDALAVALLSMDFEKDEYSTPRIAGIAAERSLYLGIVSEDSLMVKKLPWKENVAYMIATYEISDFTEISLKGSSARELAERIYSMPEYELPVCSAAAMRRGKSYELSVFNPE